jgi:hypothetical protein
VSDQSAAAHACGRLVIAARILQAAVTAYAGTHDECGAVWVVDLLALDEPDKWSVRTA